MDQHCRFVQTEQERPGDHVDESFTCTQKHVKIYKRCFGFVLID